MSNEKKMPFWTGLLQPKKSSCCDMVIEEAAAAEAAPAAPAAPSACRGEKAAEAADAAGAVTNGGKGAGHEQ